MTNPRSQSLSVKTVLLDERTVTPRYILEVKERYHLSWKDLHQEMGYSPKGHAVLNAVRQPDKYLTPAMQAQFLVTVGKLEHERGHVHFTTVTVRKLKLSKHLRIASPPRKCWGHKIDTFFGNPSQHFCDTECRELYEKRQRRKRK